MTCMQCGRPTSRAEQRYCAGCGAALRGVMRVEDSNLVADGSERAVAVSIRTVATHALSGDTTRTAMYVGGVALAIGVAAVTVIAVASVLIALVLGVVAVAAPFILVALCLGARPRYRRRHWIRL